MSTHCQIRVEGNAVLFYIHMDGYPAAILPRLLPFVQRFAKDDYLDANVLLARLGQEFMNAYDQHRAEMRAQQKDLPPSPYDFFEGFEYGTEIFGDCRYLYTVKKDGAVEVEVLAPHRTRTVPPVQHGKCWFSSLGTFAVGSKVEEAIETCKRNL